MSKENEIVKLLRQYFSAFLNATMQDSAWAIYARALSTLSLDEINAAMLKLLTTSKFWPSVAEIFEAARSVRECAQGNILPTAAEAWQEVQQLVRTCHIYMPWVYSCPEVQKTVECYGRYELCNLLESEVGIARAQFCRMYNEIVQRSEEQRQNEEVLARLPQAKRKALGRLNGKIIELAEAKAAKA